MYNQYMYEHFNTSEESDSKTTSSGSSSDKKKHPRPSDLQVQFDGEDIPYPSNPSFKQARDVSLQRVKQRYNFYMRNYQQAYALYLMYKSPYTEMQDMGKANEYKAVVSWNNAKLIQIVADIRNSNIENDESVRSVYDELALQNKKIRESVALLSAQDASVNGKVHSLSTKDEMIRYSLQGSRYEDNRQKLYIALNIIGILLLVVMFSKLQ